MFKVGKLWREYRCKLWNEFYDPLLSRNDLIKNVPKGLSMDQWALFVDYRLKTSTMNLCNRNREIRKRQTIPHTGGAMPLSRRRDNLEKIDELLLQNPEIAYDISPNDPIGVIFGKEHPSRVRGLSFRACPTLAFKHTTTRLSGVTFGSTSASALNMEEKFADMQNELATVKSQMQTLLSYIAGGCNIPEDLAVMAAGLVHTSVNQASDVGSGALSPNNIRGSSRGSNGDNEGGQRKAS
ncbi:uncharacterized protein LOC109795945 [Cajanus cajan]|uniref:uncharacterized protein LOC109795945 n=1 Tax=Cajanus cajan TaxID=3821 RepID=UPI00098D8F90|nr:uncharacterized protein LOC109795945 [Cajanus cajan]XP_029126688.1 uncharacterized protein LOC109795945 [Cajanus cajan]XP_029126689.1 uncharacterized protein LOC109795945 [Cajanus cajan]